jgi:hypothetical protein
MAKAPVKTSTIEIDQLSQGSLTVCIVGISPMYYHSMSEHARQTLLLPEATSRKSKADRAKAYKHDPMREFRDSMYYSYLGMGPTHLAAPTTMIKAAMMSAAIRMPNVTKTEIAQLVWVKGSQMPVWGVPRLKMDMVRSADMNRTPDIRTRAFVTEWAAQLTIQFLQPNLTATSVINLLAAAGLLCGIGDFRQEKGKGSFGQFRVCDPTDEDFLRLQAEAGKDAQIDAIANPVCDDIETEKLLLWYDAQVGILGEKGIPSGETALPKVTKAKRATGADTHIN